MASQRLFQRLKYDLSGIVTGQILFIWLTGPPGSGMSTLDKPVAEFMGLEVVDVPLIIKDESFNDGTDRGLAVRERLEKQRAVPDGIVVDLIKEFILKNCDADGYVISGFPRSDTQAKMFVEEITRPHLILLLKTNKAILEAREEEKYKNLSIKRHIEEVSFCIRHSLNKYRYYVEEINTNKTPDKIMEVIKEALKERLVTHFANREEEERI